ncbi:hypothetical protein [Candidatus Spyradosoma sp. SGI.093]|uniref:hypothetical protein n=1 Tax=Candidatus Spyradosoma sp. SGI.093 TaxID=3420583 RepID=UPI003D02C4F5
MRRHDALGRASARTQTRGSAAARSDAFGYNARSELTSTTLGSDAYAYAFDYVGNRGTATEKDASLSYVTNNLNQYTSRGEAAFLPLPENPSESDSEQSDRNVASPLNSSPTFSPAYDADGNATLVQTSTGTWSIAYNGENRPIRFENAATQTVVECAYDSQGRRFSSGSRGKAKRSVAFPVSRRFFERAMKISKKVAACRAASGAVPARAGRGSGFSRSRR